MMSDSIWRLVAEHSPGEAEREIVRSVGTERQLRDAPGRRHPRPGDRSHPLARNRGGAAEQRLRSPCIPRRLTPVAPHAGDGQWLKAVVHDDCDLGTCSRPATTACAEAQRWFDRGLARTCGHTRDGIMLLPASDVTDSRGSDRLPPQYGKSCGGHGPRRPSPRLRAVLHQAGCSLRAAGPDRRQGARDIFADDAVDVPTADDGGVAACHPLHPALREGHGTWCRERDSNSHTVTSTGF